MREGEEYRSSWKDIPLRGGGILGMGLGAKFLAGILTGFTPLGEGVVGRILFLVLALGFLVLGVSLASFGSARAVRFDDGGIRIVRWLAPGLALRWEEIERVESNSGIGLFHSGETWQFHTRNRRRVRLHVEAFAERERREMYGRIHARIAAPAGMAA